MRLEAESFPRLNSRGDFTVQAVVRFGDVSATALVPSGASKGTREALEIPVHQALSSFREISEAIADLDICDQERIDQTMIELDGTEDKSRLGANAILAVSLAVARVAAEYEREPLFKYLAEMYGEKKPTLLPTPMMNVINGGVHANNSLKFQEFMIVPMGAQNFNQAVRIGSEVYKTLGGLIQVAGVGDEGGYSPTITPRDQLGQINVVLDTLFAAIRKSGYKPGKDISPALDPAASEFYKDGVYELSDDDSLRITHVFMTEIYKSLVGRYNIVSIEDGLAEDDRLGWWHLTKNLGDSVQLVGDDLFVTNPRLIKEGLQEGLANAVLIKLNQIGTLTETFEAIRVARRFGAKVIISHRSGETEDTFIADLAVATRAGQIKTGAPARGERTAKYNRLLDIEQIELPRLGFEPEFAGVSPYTNFRDGI
ncbi:phosphopyruvate hydratase [Candidatus Curtissbacteria bacterium RIFCSPLOWO2_02_FULL_40_11]|uniref:Enolase n=2 Tax=Candidatus Curtissiibacteriota TaxID=1752717 RepID=A0A1F5GBK4_9BACT|nr:MAG: phosphopyruvate hydratase [Acinetobacter sp. RIFCSPHIGHO2_12_41_5]OGD89238.1 MAG: phosphopyruvate hydratase [Candidatus Curtissbacteria bacterium RIFCSPHIGHO2_02_FULL_40_16b]OGD99314.1 MAG: phosphopyruvate hydratase [Candidatus Curtissbacteria bacterium RIFCSPLOWO2_02_FULL_40_11]OGE12980.1 MAG: phosphopyruvate hydratase [Candidatus Curtissbacteria bacterium RIFCSPLOWO2_12_FULL_38_9]